MEGNEMYTVTNTDGYDCRHFKTLRNLVAEIIGNHYQHGSYSMLLCGKRLVYLNDNYLCTIRNIRGYISLAKYRGESCTLHGLKDYLSAENQPSDNQDQIRKEDGCNRKGRRTQ